MCVCGVGGITPPHLTLSPSAPPVHRSVNACLLQVCDAMSVWFLSPHPPRSPAYPSPPILKVCDAMSVGVVLAPDGSIVDFEVASTRVSITQRLT